MSRELEALQRIKGELTLLEVFNNLVERLVGGEHDIDLLKTTDKEYLFIETALKEKEKNDFELEVFKLAYEWKCNGVNGTYEEVLDKARKTVEGWKEIERKGYGTIIAD